MKRQIPAWQGRRFGRGLSLYGWLACGLVMFTAARCYGETTGCVAASERVHVPAEMAYSKGSFADAEDLYVQALLKQPHDPEMIAGLARTRVRLNKDGEAKSAVDAALVEAPHAAPLLTAQAEMQLREGQPWLARETLRRAAEADPCYARVHLVRSRIDRLDSMYATERSEIQAAYDLDSTDPEIRRAWNQTVTPAKDIAGTREYLATQKGIDPELRKAAEASVQEMLPLLSETSETCKVLPAVASATLPLLPSMSDGKHVDGYRLEVRLPQSKALLRVDTAASGLYLTRAMAEANGMVTRQGDPPGTMHADALQIGPLEFRDCLVGVSDTPFPGKGDGFIGTDLFAPYMVTLDYPAAKLMLTPLPTVSGYVPGDRPKSPELAGFSPVYHRQQYLLAPVMVNRKERRLFAIDTGMRLSTLTPEVAHMISGTQRTATNSLRTTSGSTLQIYRDSFDFEFASLSLRSRSNILELEPSAIEQHTGMESGGLLGFDMLQSMVVHLDYRDGMVKLESANAEVMPVRDTTLMAGGEGVSASCDRGPTPAEVPAAATIETRSAGLWDAAHMKPGERITVKVVHAWESPACRLDEGALLYGRVTAVSAKDAADGARLALEFDQADCFGGRKKELPLKIVSVVAAPGEFVGLHNAMPVQISGGRSRSIADATEALDNSMGPEQNLNPESIPSVVHASTVRGLPKMKLDSDGGPGCSALLTTSERSLRLGVATKFVVVLQDVATRPAQ